MSKRYRIYGETRRRAGDPSHYLRGNRTEHSWANRPCAGTYTALQAVKKAAHVNALVRQNNPVNPPQFSIEVVEDDAEN